MVRSSPPSALPSLRRWAPLFLVAAVLLAYGNNLQAPLLFDDLTVITHNPSIRQFTTALTPPTDGSSSTGRPLVNLSFALNYAISGEAVWSYHLLNILIHAGAALALFGLARRTPSWTESGAFVLALLWAVHPLQTESVTGVASRTESLCGLFYLLTLYCFARGGRWLGLSVFACLAGMATKEVMVTAPLVVLLYDRTFVAGSFAGAWRLRWGYYCALAATWLLLAWLVLGGGGTRGVSAGLGLGLSWWTYLLTQCQALVLYLKLSFWPHPLILDYGTGVVESWREVWWQGLLILALLAGTGWALVCRPKPGFLGAAFFLILAPSSSVIPIVSQTMAEHRMYLPLAAVLALTVGAAVRRVTPRAVVLAGLVLALACGWATHRRNTTYLDEQRMWEDVLVHRPENARAHNNLGRVHYQQGRRKESVPHFQAAVRLDPANPHAWYNLGLALMNTNAVAGAEAPLAEAVRLLPAYFDARLNLGIVLLQQGRPEEALPHLAEAVRLDSAQAEGHLQHGMALAALRRWPEAGEQYAQTLKLDPASAAAHSNWGVALFQMRDPVGAIGHFEQALLLEPGLPEVHVNLALALGAQGRWPEAREHLESALRLRPDFTAARDLLRSLDAEHPR